MKKNDVVKIKPAFCGSENEKKTLFVVVDDMDGGARCIIQPITGNAARLPIVPAELVGVDMLEETGLTVDDLKK